jgi:hypothetical protein
MGRWEWIILELGFLGLLVWELFSVRRSIKRARAEKETTAGD